MILIWKPGKSVEAVPALVLSEGEKHSPAAHVPGTKFMGELNTSQCERFLALMYVVNAKLNRAIDCIFY